MKIEQLDMTQAACKDVDPEMFFPEQGSKYKTAEAAKDVCTTCAIKFDCLQVALEHGYAGVWGGLTDIERQSLQRKERRSRRGRMHESDVRNLRVDKTVQKASLEAANAARVAKASSNSVELVKKALEIVGDRTPANLRQVAQARLDYPSASHQELAHLLGVTKDSYSGAIRRLLKRANM